MIPHVIVIGSTVKQMLIHKTHCSIAIRLLCAFCVGIRVVWKFELNVEDFAAFEERKEFTSHILKSLLSAEKSFSHLKILRSIG
jgi:hypothetical protein